MNTNDNSESFKKEFGLIIIGAIIFTASFLWKDLFNDVEEMYFPKAKGLLGRVFFTFIVTVLLIFLAVFLRRMLGLDTQNVIKFDDNPIGNDSDDGDDF